MLLAATSRGLGNASVTKDMRRMERNVKVCYNVNLEKNPAKTFFLVLRYEVTYLINSTK